MEQKARIDRYKYGLLLIAALAGVGYLEFQLLPGVLTILIVTFFAIACAAETASMLKKSGVDPFEKASISLVVLFVAAYAFPKLQLGFGSTDSLGTLSRFRTAELAAGAFVFFCAAAVLRQKTEGAAQTLAGGLLVITVAACLLAMVDIRFLNGDPSPAGMQLLLFLVAVSKAGDIAGYLIGSTAGKNKLIPAVSPGKTWEGAIASLIAAVGVAGVFGVLGFCGPLSIEQCIFGGVTINIASQFGDLAESLFKRSAGVKDSGNWLPQFGGAFDLVDSLFLAAPAFYGFLRVAVY
ncbi:MAG: phosphatidate cytidylyltransferase [Planctomycetota bacterium]